MGTETEGGAAEAGVIPNDVVMQMPASAIRPSPLRQNPMSSAENNGYPDINAPLSTSPLSGTFGGVQLGSTLMQLILNCNP